MRPADAVPPGITSPASTTGRRQAIGTQPADDSFPGDRLSAVFGGGFGIDGTVWFTGTASLFQVVGLPPGSGLRAPPDNVVLLPSAQWARYFAGAGGSRPRDRQF